MESCRGYSEIRTALSSRQTILMRRELLPLPRSIPVKVLRRGVTHLRGADEFLCLGDPVFHLDRVNAEFVVAEETVVLEGVIARARPSLLVVRVDLEYLPTAEASDSHGDAFDAHFGICCDGVACEKLKYITY